MHSAVCHLHRLLHPRRIQPHAPFFGRAGFGFQVSGRDHRRPGADPGRPVPHLHLENLLWQEGQKGQASSSAPV